jgi:hypothetical protein
MIMDYTDMLIDATPEAIRSVIEFLNGEQAARLLKGRYIYVKYDAMKLSLPVFLTQDP